MNELIVINRKGLLHIHITICACIACILILPGCITTPVGMAPSTIPLTSSDQYTVLSQEEVSGTSSGISFLNMFALKSLNTEDAKTEAIKSAAADALIDVTVDCSSFNFPLRLFPVITIDSVTVRGKPIKLNR